MKTKVLRVRDNKKCCNCARVKQLADNSYICRKHGVVAAYDHCHSFKYDPLLREPVLEPEIETYSANEFEL